MKTAPNAPCDYYVIVRHPDLEQILAIDRGRDGYALPHWRDRRIRWAAANHVTAMVQERFGTPIFMLRCLGIGRGPGGEWAALAYEAEAMGPIHCSVGNLCWTRRRQLSDVRLPRGLSGMDMESALAEIAGGTPPGNRVPWARPGWFRQCVVWIEGQLIGNGVNRTGPIEQIQTRQRGCVMRIPTDQGYVYFKASPEFFSQEAPLVVYLDDRYSGLTPRVLASDLERRWTLTRESAGERLDTITQAETWKEALRTYAELQIRSADHVHELLTAGCPDRRLSSLKTHIASLVEDSTPLRVGHFAFSDGDLRLLQGLVPALLSACDKLAEYSIPASIEHGDFAAFNIIGCKNGFVFLDWSEASVAHPFLGSVAFSERIQGYGVDLTQMQERGGEQLEEAYLAPWLQFESKPRLLEAYRLARPLSAAHYALSSLRFVLPSIEARWEEENMFVYYARLILEHRDELEAMIA